MFQICLEHPKNLAGHMVTSTKMRIDAKVHLLTAVERLTRRETYVLPPSASLTSKQPLRGCSTNRQQELQSAAEGFKEITSDII